MIFFENFHLEDCCIKKSNKWVSFYNIDLTIRFKNKLFLTLAQAQDANTVVYFVLEQRGFNYSFPQYTWIRVSQYHNLPYAFSCSCKGLESTGIIFCGSSDGGLLMLRYIDVEKYAEEKVKEMNNKKKDN